MGVMWLITWYQSYTSTSTWAYFIRFVKCILRIHFDEQSMCFWIRWTTHGCLVSHSISVRKTTLLCSTTAGMKQKFNDFTLLHPISKYASPPFSNVYFYIYTTRLIQTCKWNNNQALNYMHNVEHNAEQQHN